MKNEQLSYSKNRKIYYNLKNGRFIPKRRNSDLIQFDINKENIFKNNLKKINYEEEKRKKKYSENLSKKLKMSNLLREEKNILNSRLLMNKINLKKEIIYKRKIKKARKILPILDLKKKRNKNNILAISSKNIIALNIENTIYLYNPKNPILKNKKFSFPKKNVTRQKKNYSSENKNKNKEKIQNQFLKKNSSNSVQKPYKPPKNLKHLKPPLNPSLTKPEILKTFQKLYTAYPCETITTQKFSPCGNFLSIGNILGDITIFDLCKNRDLITYNSHSKKVNSLIFEKNRITSCSDDRKIVLNDIRAKFGGFSELRGHGNFVNAICYDESGGFLGSAGSDRKVVFWSLRKLDGFFGRREFCYPIFDFCFDRNFVSDVFVADGDFFKVYDFKRDFFLMEKKMPAVIDCFRFFGGEVVSSHFFGNGSFFYFWGKKGFRKRRSFRAHDDEVVSMDFFDNEKFLVSAGRDDMLKIWDFGHYSKRSHNHFGFNKNHLLR